MIFAFFLAILLGAAGAFGVLSVAGWVVLNLSGELGDTPNTLRRSKHVARFVTGTIACGVLVIVGGVIAVPLNLLPHGWWWAGFAATAVLVFCVILSLAVARFERGPREVH